MMQRQAFAWSLLVATSLVTACAAGAKSSRAPAAPAAREAPISIYQAPAAPAPAASATGYADVNTDSSLISNGSVAASSDNLLSTASAFRREVYRLGGRVFAE